MKHLMNKKKTSKKIQELYLKAHTHNVTLWDSNCYEIKKKSNLFIFVSPQYVIIRFVECHIYTYNLVYIYIVHTYLNCSKKMALKKVQKTRSTFHSKKKKHFSTFKVKTFLFIFTFFLFLFSLLYNWYHIFHHDLYLFFPLLYKN